MAHITAATAAEWMYSNALAMVHLPKAAPLKTRSTPIIDTAKNSHAPMPAPRTCGITSQVWHPLGGGRATL